MGPALLERRASLDPAQQGCSQQMLAQMARGAKMKVSHDTGAVAESVSPMSVYDADQVLMCFPLIETVQSRAQLCDFCTNAIT